MFLSVSTELRGGLDTLFIKLGSDFLIDQIESEQGFGANAIDIVSGGRDNDVNVGGRMNGFLATSIFLPASNALAIAPALTDTLTADSLISMTISGTGNEATHSGGMLSNLGVDTDINLSFWTNRQTTPVSMDSVDLIAVSDTLRTLEIVKSDSTAGETSSDTLIVTWDTGVIPPGSYFTVQLDTGNTFTGASDASSDISIFTSQLTPINRSNITTSDITGTNIGGKAKITIDNGDTLGFTGTGPGDTLKIYFGNTLITNVHPDSLTFRSKSYLPTSDGTIPHYYTVRAFDANDDTIFTYGVSEIVAEEEIAVVSNFFDGGPIFNKSSTFTAGAATDTLEVPFQVGTPITNTTMVFTFDGAIYTDETVAETATNYVVKGDTAGFTTLSLVSANTPPDNVITFTLAAGDSVGGTGTVGIAYQETLLVIGVLTALGTDGTDGLDVSFTTTNVQSIAATDTSNVAYALNLAAQDVTGGGPVSGVSGTATNFKGGWDATTSHGVVIPGGQIVFRFPVDQDITKTHAGLGTGRYEYSFPSFSPGALSTGDFLVTGEIAASTLDTLTLSAASYAVETGAGAISDTGVVTLTVAAGNNIINSDSLLTVEIINNRLTNPLEATTSGAGATINTAHNLTSVGGTDFSNLPAADVDYRTSIEIYDDSGNKMTAGRSDLGWSTFTAGVFSKYVILLPGQSHDPGGDGSLNDPDTVIVSNGLMPLVLATDANNNIISDGSKNDNLTITLHTGAAAADGPAIRFIGDEVCGSSDDLDPGDAADGAAGADPRNAQAHFDTADSLKFFQAADGKANLGRSGLLKNIKVTDGTDSGTSDNIPVTNSTIAGIVVIVEDFEEVEQTGDSTGTGKKTIRVPFELAQGATFNVEAVPVDNYLNRVETTAALLSPATTLTITASGLSPSDATTDFTEANDFKATFTITPQSTGTSQSVTVAVTSTPTISGSTTFDVVGVVSSAVFTALADTSNKLGDFHNFTVDLTFSGAFGGTDTWSFYAHTDSTFAIMNEDQGGIRQTQNGTITSGALGVTASFGGNIDLRPFTKMNWFISIQLFLQTVLM